MAAIHDIDNFLENDVDGIYSELRSLGLNNETIRDFMSSVANDGIDLTIDNASKIRNSLNVMLRGQSHVKESEITEKAIIKTPLEIVLESFSLSDVAREALGEAPIANMDNKDAIATLKEELVYCKTQATTGPAKSRHVFANKAEKIKEQLEKFEIKKLHEKLAEELKTQSKPKIIKEAVIDFNTYFKKL